MVGATFDDESSSDSDGIPTLDEIKCMDGDRIDTGIESLNRVFGTNRNDSRCGIAIPSTTIFSGTEGSGKSTLLLKMLAMTREKRALLICSEQRLEEVKATIMGTGLSHAAKKIFAYSLLDDHCGMDVAFEIINKFNPRLLVVDSVTKMRESSTSIKRSNQSNVRVVEAFKRDAEQNNRAVIMVAHVTKDRKIAGANEMMHDVSTLLLLTKAGPNYRILQSPGKNRFGDTSEQAFFFMQRTGMREVTSDEEIGQIRTIKAEMKK